MSDEQRLTKLLDRLANAERRVQLLVDKFDDGVEKVKRDLAKRKVYNAIFVTVPSDYYERPLEERAVLLNNSDVSQLCKTIIFENTAASHDEFSDPTNSRYYCVVVQYAARFDAELLRDVIHNLRKGEDKLPRKRFHFQLAPEEVSDRLSGFIHNAVTPFGMAESVPVVLCSNCLKMRSSYIYLGGGKVDVKLGMPLEAFIRSTNPIIATLTVLRFYGFSVEIPYKTATKFMLEIGSDRVMPKYRINNVSCSVKRKYEVHRTLGEGSFGKVKYGVNKETREAVAIKILDKEVLRKKNMSVQIKREISLMRIMNHPAIIQIKDVFATENKIYMVLELVEGGELFDKIVERGKFTPQETRFYMRQLIDGMLACHDKGICHRDLKPENLLLDAAGNIKISDFGMARLYIGDPDADGEARSELLHTTCGTPNYVAPEVLTCKGYDGHLADVWSMGVILYVLLAGYLPFEEATTAALFKKIKNADFTFPSWFDPQALDLVKRILVVDPKIRLNLPEFRESPFISNPDTPSSPPFPLVQALPEAPAAAEAPIKEKKKSHLSHTHVPDPAILPPNPPKVPSDEDVGASSKIEPITDASEDVAEAPAASDDGMGSTSASLLAANTQHVTKKTAEATAPGMFECLCNPFSTFTVSEDNNK